MDGESPIEPRSPSDQPAAPLPRVPGADSQEEAAAVVEQPSGADCVHFEGVAVVGETTLSLRCRVQGQEVSIPRRHILSGGLLHTGDRGALVIPRWLAHGQALIVFG